MTSTQMEQKKTKVLAPSQSGLEDMVATDSSICFIDGPNCRLIYRGYSISDLAASSTFEEVVYLLLNKNLPTSQQLEEFSQKLASCRTLPEDIINRLKTIPKNIHPMVVLRTLISSLSFSDPDAEKMNPQANLDKAIRVISQTASLVAAWDRFRQGKEILAPKTHLSHAANFLYMLDGKEPNVLFTKAIDLYLVLLADHELNASTFALRVTASTLSDYYSAITSAIGALKGPLHGGANEEVIKMLLEIKDPSKVDSFLHQAFDQKKKIMGFGHRVYKLQDPRSPLLKAMAAEVCKKTNNFNLIEMSEKIEKAVTSAKQLPSNVDFYSASLLYCVGIPTDLFTPLFVMSRIAGYSAHYLEQVTDNRLIRPRANYTGGLNLTYIGIHKR